MTVVEAFVPAKVNLTLHVTGQREDGYHTLDSLAMFADIGDRMTITMPGDYKLTVEGPMAEGVPEDESNLVLRAARMMRGISCRFSVMSSTMSRIGWISPLWIWGYSSSATLRSSPTLNALPWLPMMIALAWTALYLIPALFGISIGTLYLFLPDMALMMMATAATGLLWAVFRLGVFYSGRS